MKRILVVLAALALALAGLIGAKVNEQEEVLHGPSRGSGVIEGTEVDLAARVAARILEVNVARGQSVKRGDLLLRLDCSDAVAVLSEAEAKLAAARAQADAAGAVAAAARGQRDAASAAAEAARAQAQAVAAQRDAVARQADRLDALQDDVPLASRDQTRAQASGLDGQAKAAGASGKAGEAQARAARSQSEAAAAQAEAARLAVEAGEAAVSRARLLVAECDVTSPRDAVVDDVMYEPGELAPLGMPLVRLVDLARVEATFYLPNAELAAVKSGAEAVVEADAWPGQSWKGRVATVSTRAEFTPRNIQTRTDRDRLVYPVEVVLDNADGRLRPGMPVQITLPGTER